MVLQLEEKALEEYRLDDILNGGKLLVKRQRMGAIIIYQDAQKEIVQLESFSNQELVLLLPLLQNYPQYCPYEVIYTWFYRGENPPEKDIEKARKKLYAALEEGMWDYEMKPVRNVLSRVRIKVHTFGINILAILETGYTLLPVKNKEHHSET